MEPCGTKLKWFNRLDNSLNKINIICGAIDGKKE